MNIQLIWRRYRTRIRKNALSCVVFGLSPITFASVWLLRLISANSAPTIRSIVGIGEQVSRRCRQSWLIEWPPDATARSSAVTPAPVDLG